MRWGPSGQVGAVPPPDFPGCLLIEGFEATVDAGTVIVIMIYLCTYCEVMRSFGDS